MSVRSVKYQFLFSGLVKSNQYLNDPHRYIIAVYCLHVIWFVICIVVLKVTMKENSFACHLQRDESLQCWKFREFILSILCNILITSGKKRNRVSIAITSSNSILCCFFGCTARIHFMLSLFLVYIKSNHIISTVKQLAAGDILLFIAIC